MSYRARVSDQLGSASVEPVGEGPSALFDDALALAGLSAAAAVAAAALPEREPHPGAFYAFEALTNSLIHPDIWPAIFVRFEPAGLLQDLGFGLDLSKCAATGALDNLIYVSPRTGRAVSAEAGKLLTRTSSCTCRPSCSRPRAAFEPGDVGAGLDLTAHFLQAFVFNPLNRPLPQARLWLVDRLSDADRL